jgi:hypothetical protein
MWKYNTYLHLVRGEPAPVDSWLGGTIHCYWVTKAHMMIKLCSG